MIDSAKAVNGIYRTINHIDAITASIVAMAGMIGGVVGFIQAKMWHGNVTAPIPAAVVPDSVPVVPNPIPVPATVEESVPAVNIAPAPAIASQPVSQEQPK